MVTQGGEGKRGGGSVVSPHGLQLISRGRKSQDELLCFDYVYILKSDNFFIYPFCKQDSPIKAAWSRLLLWP